MERRQLYGYFGMLMEAPSKDMIQQIFTHVYMHRNDMTQTNAQKFADKFRKPDRITADHVKQLFLAVCDLIGRALYENVSGAEQVGQLLGTGLDDRLKTLISQILAKNMPIWREAAVISRVSLPQLIDVDWRIDVKTAAEQMSRMAVPTVLVDLKVQLQPEMRGQVPGVKDVNFELSKEALHTMLDGLGKIRDQLSSIK